MPARSLSHADWHLARLTAADRKPAADEWISATVSGAVQFDWGRAHNLHLGPVGHAIAQPETDD